MVSKYIYIYTSNFLHVLKPLPKMTILDHYVTENKLIEFFFQNQLDDAFEVKNPKILDLTSFFFMHINLIYI